MPSYARQFFEAPLDPPNTRYESKSLGTWSSTSDVDTFLSKYTNANNYAYSSSDYLSLGNYVTISDGTYNVDWEIAGFDCEYNNKASDGQVKSNGYGIFMIPKPYLKATHAWHSDYTVATPYKDSDMHTWLNSTVYNALYNILGTHIQNRQVLLGSSCDSSTWKTNGYTWTTSYLTLMSVCQLTGTKASYCNKYDDGEANYKLPLFNYENRAVYWLRCIWGLDHYYLRAWCNTSINYFSSKPVDTGIVSCPLLMIR